MLIFLLKQTATTHSHVCLTLGVVAKQTATTHSHVCLTLGVVEKQTATTLFYKMPNVRRSNEPNTYFN